MKRTTSRRVPLPMALSLSLACFSVGLFFDIPIGRDGLPGNPEESFEPDGAPHPVFATPGLPSLSQPRALKLVPEPSPDFGADGNNYISSQPYKILSWQPRAILLQGFLPPEKCDQVVASATKRLAPSGLALRKGDTVEGTRDEDKIAQTTLLPSGHGEPFNILRYEHSQKYDAHYDTFDPASYGPQSSQRIATLLTYLTDVEEGGETIFPLEGPDGLSRLRDINYKSCDVGYKVKPKKGDAILFYSIHPNGTFDKHALHGSCPVIKGTKWAAVKWIRDKCMGRKNC